MRVEQYTNRSDEQFYPTPEPLIKKMLQGVAFDEAKTILEPSAGKGNIAKELKRRWELRNNQSWRGQENVADIDCIEIDEYLCHILKGEGLRVIHNDFLTFTTQKKYDLIVMNPPFQDGEKHLLKAIELQQNGGAIVCLLNATTLKNPSSNNKRLLLRKLEELGAKVEYLSGAFTTAERVTDVEVAIIRIFIESRTQESQLIKSLKKESRFDILSLPEPEYATENQELIPSDVVKRMATLFNLEAEAGVRFIKEYQALKHHLRRDSSQSILTLSVGSDSNILQTIDTNEFLKKLRYRYWSELFDNKKLKDRLTNNLLWQYTSKIESLMDYDFTEYNVRILLIEIFGHLHSSIKNSIVNMFDTFISYSQYEGCKNIHYFNGWRTNKAHKINKRVIVPVYSIKKERYHIWGNLNINRIKDVLEELERVFNYLEGCASEKVNHDEILQRMEQTGVYKNIETKYFILSFFQKGTMHITFKSEQLLNHFNIFCAREKKWLPPDYGKKPYSKFTSEEKEVVDSFQAEDEYNSVLAKQQYFLSGVQTNLLQA